MRLASLCGSDLYEEAKLRSWALSYHVLLSRFGLKDELNITSVCQTIETENVVFK
jgi:hypothetical protein